jgi:hypothetical protein
LINPFSLSEKERILSWRQLRNTIKSLPIPDACDAVAGWWAQAPLHAHGLDYNDLDSWKDPWAMLEDNYFNRNTLAYMIWQTFELSDANKFSAKLILIHDFDVAVDDIYWTVLVDSKYVLNYNIAKTDLLSNIKKNIAIKRQY